MNYCPQLWPMSLENETFTGTTQEAKDRQKHGQRQSSAGSREGAWQTNEQQPALRWKTALQHLAQVRQVRENFSQVSSVPKQFVRWERMAAIFVNWQISCQYHQKLLPLT